VAGDGGGGILLRSDEFALIQTPNGFLDCAFRQSGGAGDVVVARGEGWRSLKFTFGIEVEIDEKCGGVPVVTDQIPHQGAHHVFIDCYALLHYSVLCYSTRNYIDPPPRFPLGSGA